MTTTIAAVMRHCNNFFEREAVEGDFAISDDGVLSPAVDAPYIAISGSAYHDGVHMVNNVPSGPQDSFHGIVWKLYPPADLIALCNEIKGFESKHPTGTPASESFGGYSVSYRNGMETWQGAFAHRLRPYMRMFTEVGV